MAQEEDALILEPYDVLAGLVLVSGLPAPILPSILFLDGKRRGRGS
jgi:hypothetical protein